MCKKEDCFWYRREHHTDHYTDDCGRNMPDSMDSCKGICEHFEPREEKQLTIFDELNKMCFNEEKTTQADTIAETILDNLNQPIEKVAIKGVGKDAEMIVSKNGGKQSKTPAALHLVTPEFIREAAQSLPETNIKRAIFEIVYFMIKDEWYKIDNLYTALKRIEPDEVQRVFKIGKVMQEGADRYEPNNWRLIPQEQHINHALIHLFAAALGDTQDNHLDHALCRLMFACNTEPSSSFSYKKYKGKSK